MELLEKFAPKKNTLVLTNVGKRAMRGVLHTRRKWARKKKKKNPGINQCGEKGSGGYYIPSGFEDLKNSEPSAPSIINKIKYGYGRTNLPTQRTRRKRAGKKKKNP
jgi:hypothetical protein